MRQLFLCVGAILLACQVSSAQPAHKRKSTNYSTIGITYSLQGDAAITYANDVAGGAGYNYQRSFTASINYLYRWNRWLGIETGLGYAEYSFRVDPTYPGIPSHPTHTAFLYVPVTLRVDFLRYFYLNGGLLVDIDASNSRTIDEQTGLGGTMGIAAKYDFDFGASLFINPSIKLHSAIPFKDEGIHQRILELPIRFGITYRLD